MLNQVSRVIFTLMGYVKEPKPYRCSRLKFVRYFCQVHLFMFFLIDYFNPVLSSHLNTDSVVCFWYFLHNKMACHRRSIKTEQWQKNGEIPIVYSNDFYPWKLEDESLYKYSHPLGEIDSFNKCNPTYWYKSIYP